MNIKSLLKKKSSLLILMLLVLSIFTLFTNRLPEQCITIENKQIPLSNIPEGWELSIISSLQISLGTWEFFMCDIKTGNGIPDVHIFLETDALGQHGTLSVYTDESGYAKITAIRVDQARITTIHPQYYQRSEIISSGVAYVYVDWFLTPLTEPQPNLVKVTLYAQVAKKSYVIIGGVDTSGQHMGFDRRQPQRAVMWLQKNTIHTIQISGWYNRVERDIFGGYSGYNPVNFNYMKQITTTNVNVEYWIDLQSGDIHTGVPPLPEDGGGSLLSLFLSFLTNYGLLIAGAIILLYALPHVASILRTIKGGN